MKKLRMTHQREIILQELKKSKNHPSADELYEIVKKKLPRISLATVYRNLEVLSETGVINKIEISGRQKRFDWNRSRHDHIYCVQCHRVDNMDMEAIEKPTLPPVHTRGYRLEGCRVEFYGYCPECLTKDQQKGEKAMGCKKCGSSSVSDEQKKVLKALAESKEPCGTKDITAATGLASKQVSDQIATLKKKGYVASPARCRYEITREGNKVIG